MTTSTLPASPALAARPSIDHLVEVRDLRRTYGTTEVLRGISFGVRRGELFGLLGTNGAGKTTTVEILQGLRHPDSGEVSVLGLDPRLAGDQLRRRIGSQLQDAALPDRMRVQRGARPLRVPAPESPAARRAGRRVAAGPPPAPTLRRPVGWGAPAAVRGAGAGGPTGAGVPRRAHPEPGSGRAPAHLGRDPTGARRRHDRGAGDARRRGGRAAVRPHRRPRSRSGGRRRLARRDHR